MGWKTVAEGMSLSDLEQTVADMELPKGTKVRVVMDTWAPWAFDFALAEPVFRPFVPGGLELLDVWGEGGQGVVEMEADPAWLIATIIFIKTHWLAITLAGLALAVLISFITVLIKVPAAAQIPVALLAGVALGIVGLIILTRRVPT